MQVRIQIKDNVFNKVYLPYLEDNHRYQIFYGGAGSGKSYFVAQKIIYRCLSKPEYNVIAVRKLQSTLRDSVYAQLERVINEWGLASVVTMKISERAFDFSNGSRILCKGLDDPEKIKSISFKHGDVSMIWIEEATEITRHDLIQLDMRMRGRDGYEKQMVLSFNPISEKHHLKERFFINQNDRMMICKTTYRDNEYIDEEYKRTLKELKGKDENYYRIYALGEWGLSADLVFNHWTVGESRYQPYDYDYIAFGQDWGYNHPAATVLVGVKDDVIYVLKELYLKQKTTSDLKVAVKEFVNNAHESIICDSAEPDRIAEFKGYGLNARAVEKTKESVMTSIDWIKSKQLVVSESCVNTQRELFSYKFKVDKHSDTATDEVVKLDDDCIDAMRYALLPYIMSSKRPSGAYFGAYDE